MKSLGCFLLAVELPLLAWEVAPGGSLLLASAAGSCKTVVWWSKTSTCGKLPFFHSDQETSRSLLSAIQSQISHRETQTRMLPWHCSMFCEGGGEGALLGCATAASGGHSDDCNTRGGGAVGCSFQVEMFSRVRCQLIYSAWAVDTESTSTQQIWTGCGSAESRAKIRSSGQTLTFESRCFRFVLISDRLKMNPLCELPFDGSFSTTTELLSVSLAILTGQITLQIHFPNQVCLSHSAWAGAEKAQTTSHKFKTAVAIWLTF